MAKTANISKIPSMTTGNTSVSPANLSVGSASPRLDQFYTESYYEGCRSVGMRPDH